MSRRDANSPYMSYMYALQVSKETNDPNLMEETKKP